MSLKKINTMNYLVSLFISLVYILVIAGSIYAQTPSDKQQISEALGKKIRRVLDRQNYQEYLIYETHIKINSALDFRADSDEATTNLEKKYTFFIRNISLKNAKHLSTHEISILTELYQNKFLNQQDIFNLIRSINLYYFNQGYITTRVYLPNQNLKTEQLILEVQVGHVSDIQSDSLSDNEIQTAFPNMIGETFNLRNLEQGLHQMNLLDSNQVGVLLLPSDTEENGTQIYLKNISSSKHGLLLEYNSFQPQLLLPNYIAYTKHNFFNLNDLWEVGYTYQKGEDLNFSDTFHGSVSVPYGYLTLTAKYLSSGYRDVLVGKSGNYDYHGNSSIQQLSGESVVIRTDVSKSSVHTSYVSKNYNSFIEDAENQSGTYRLRIFELGGKHIWYAPFGNIALGVTYQQGLDGFGASKDSPSISKTSPHAQFSKFNTDLIYISNINLFEQEVSYKGVVKFQFSPHTLYSTEQFSLGGFYLLKGFGNQYAQGDSGAYISQELSMSLSQQGDWQGFIQLEGGFIDSIGGLSANNGEGRGKLLSTSCGLRYYQSGLEGQVSLSKGLISPSFMKDNGLQLQGQLLISLF